MVWHNATLKGKIIIRISIKILFKSYLLIEYIPVTQFMVSHLFLKKSERGLKISQHDDHSQFYFYLHFPSPSLATRLGPVLGALHYSKPGL